ncbi:MAG: tetratricopeptide repeat protein [Endomicrobium sp.]|jgi:tetratricopeptide (TPR) repeat protein|nr:tetratricopeptide repeat protein [Endomicrobium sp.]
MFKFLNIYFYLLFLCLCIGCDKDNYNIFRKIAKATASTESTVSEGQTALANGNYDQAKEIFKQIIDRSPSDRKAIAGYIAAAVRIPDLIGDIVEASQEFKDSGNETIDVNKYKNVAIDRVHEMKEDLDYLLVNPTVVQTMLSEPESQANVNNAAAFFLAAAVTLADNSAIKTALGIVGDDVDFNEINNKELPDTLKTIPEAMDAISQASQFLDFAQNCATKIADEKGIITPEMVAKLQDAKDQLLRIMNS